jgi:hypothetical protein
MTTFKPQGMMSSGGGEVLQRVSPGGVSSRYIFRAVFSREYPPGGVFQGDSSRVVIQRVSSREMSS